MKDGTSEEEWAAEARGARWALNAAAEEGTDTHRHHLHALVTEAFATEDPRELREVLAEAGEALVRWVDELEARLAESAPAEARAP